MEPTWACSKALNSALTEATAAQVEQRADRVRDRYSSMRGDV